MCSEKQDTYICQHCKVEKPLSNYYSHKSKKNGKQYRNKTCIECYKVKSKNQRNIRKYGLTALQVEKMIERQRMRCFICERTFNRKKRMSLPAVDHCHTSGRVRGILCGFCNTGLGMFKDNPDVLEKAAQYIREDIV